MRFRSAHALITIKTPKPHAQAQAEGEARSSGERDGLQGRHVARGGVGAAVGRPLRRAQGQQGGDGGGQAKAR